MEGRLSKSVILTKPNLCRNDRVKYCLLFTFVVDKNLNLNTKGLKYLSRNTAEKKMSNTTESQKSVLEPTSDADWAAFM